MEDWRNDTGSENPSIWENICPYVTLSTTNPSHSTRPQTVSVKYFLSHHSPNLMPYSFRYPQCNKISSGVLLGSVLGPLLFLVYVNVTWRNIDSSIRFFADDCIMCRKIIKKNIVRLWKELERGVGGRK